MILYAENERLFVSGHGFFSCEDNTLDVGISNTLVRCIGWLKNNRADDLTFYLDTLIRTGIKCVEATLGRRRILFAGFVARKEDTRLPKCVVLGELARGAGCVGSQEKKWMGCFLDDLRAFGINADQWTTAGQGDGEWRSTAEQGVECFMAKLIAAEKRTKTPEPRAA